MPRSQTKPTYLARWTLLLLLGITPVVAVRPVYSDEAVRWQLASGAELKYEISKSASVSLGNDSSTYRLTQLLNVTWRVTAVDQAGAATIEQEVDRIRLELDDPLGDVRYDSDVDEEPGSLAALTATVFSAMLEHNLQFTLDPDGTIGQINIPEPLLHAVEKVSFARTLDHFASEEGLRELLVPRLPVVPDGELEPGQEWIAQVEQLPGNVQLDVVYHYAGTREQDGTPLAAIEQSRTVHLTGENALEIKDQRSSGELLFDRSEGRLKSNHWSIDVEVTDAAGQKGRLQQEFRMQRVP